MNEVINLLQGFAMGLLELMLPIVAGFVVAALIVLKNKWLQELENSKPELRWYLDEAVSLAVAAAEQSHLIELISDKKQYAVEVAQIWLDAHGWDEVDIDVLEAAIEAEVLKQFPK